MSESTTPHNRSGSSGIGEYLDLASTRLQRGEFALAVEAIRSAKSLEPKNIYVLAFEKQTEELRDLQANGTLTDEQRTDIFDSIPSILEKALELSRTSSGVTDLSALGRPVQDFTKQSQERTAALEWLKNQYFQHAHEYVRKGEYQHALAEVRRVYIIDSSNAVAKELEKQIDQLAQMQSDPSASGRSRALSQAQASVPSHSGAGMVVPAPGGGGHPEPAISAAAVSEAKKRAPQHAVRSVEHGAVQPAKKSYASAIIILLIVIALGVVILFFTIRAKARRSPGSESIAPAPAPEEFVGRPARTADQNFEFSTAPADSGATQAVTQVGSAETTQDDQGKTEEPAPSKGSGPNASSTRPESGTRNVEDLSGGTIHPPPDRSSTAEPAASGLLPEPNAAETSSPTPFVAVEKEAQILHLAPITITQHMIDRGASGRVVLRVQIDQTGKPVQTVTLQSTNDLLIQPVIEAVMASQFSPAEMSTGPITSWLTIPFNLKPGK